MAELTVRSDHVDVEEIMRQIRARVREKRGVDYTEQELQELASVRLEQFLDPQAVRSELLKAYRDRQNLPPNYGFDEDTLYASSRGGIGRLLAWSRRLLNPILKLFFNPGPLVHVLNLQSQMNEHFLKRDALQFELFHNVVVELTRLGIENRNLKMRIESLQSRLDFHERRARALEGVVEYRRGAAPGEASRETPREGPREGEGANGEAERPSRRRRRRRSRRPAGVRGQDSSASAERATVDTAGGEEAEGRGEPESRAGNRESGAEPQEAGAGGGPTSRSGASETGAGDSEERNARDHVASADTPSAGKTPADTSSSET